MVDLEFLDKIKLATTPWAQIFVALAILAPNYNLFAKVNIEMENIDNIPINFLINSIIRNCLC